MRKQPDQHKLHSALLALMFALVVVVLAMTHLQGLEIARVSRSLMAAKNVQRVEKDRGLLEVFQEFQRDKEKSTAGVQNVPAGMSVIASVSVDNCSPDPDGVCGYNLFVYGPSDWEAPGSHELYLAETAGGPLSFYGPYMGDLKKIAAEAKLVKALTELR